MLADHLRPGDGVLDLGANIGAYSSWFAEIVGPTGKVLGVEPGTENIRQARDLNAKFPWVTLMQVACGAWHGETQLYVDSEHGARNSCYRSNVVKDGGETETVQQVPLDFLATLVPNLRGIKIDVQGSEMDVLKGGAQTLQNRDLIWQVELWPMGLTNAGSSWEAVVKVFRSAGCVPIGETWDRVIEAMPSQTGHASHDVLLRHQSSPTES